MILTLDCKFNIGDIVYFVTDEKQSPHMVVGVLVTMNGTYRYQLSQRTTIDWGYECELAIEKDVLMQLNSND
jgi:hypothetical protein